jgi:hypothetical protein
MAVPSTTFKPNRLGPDQFGVASQADPFPDERLPERHQSPFFVHGGGLSEVLIRVRMNKPA